MSKKHTPSTLRLEYPTPKGKLLVFEENENKGKQPEKNSNQEGRKMEVPGSGIVVVMDGKTMSATKIYEVELETPVSVRGLKIHFPGKGEEYFLLLPEQQIIIT